MCIKCCERKVDKSNNPDEYMKVRCPLCVKQNCHILASELGLTNNGKDTSALGQEGAAPTVLKWGGGYTSDQKKKEKKLKRPKSNESKIASFKSIVCKFGSKCPRENCWFQHPNR